MQAETNTQYQSLSTDDFVMTPEEGAAQLLTDLNLVISTDSDDATEHNVLIDSAQLLVLSGFTLDQVMGSARADARTKNDYSVGRVFDVVSPREQRYSRHVESIARSIQPSDVVGSGQVYRANHLSTRMQFQIVSEIQDEMKNGKKTGRQFYFVARAYVGSGPDSGPVWQFTEVKNGINRRIRLYTNPATQQFWTESKGDNGKVVRQMWSLCTTDYYEAVKQSVYKIDSTTGLSKVDVYRNALNSFDLDELEQLADDKQVLFLSVYKTLKA
jgi:hypothetical protein